ncbi:MAG: hypothetical protein WBC63_06820 [Candidatus Bipolaricaulia bacterium]
MGQTGKWGLLALVIGGAVASALLAPGTPSEMLPFGGADDVAFAEDLWSTMGDYADWPMSSDVSVGGTPHGAFVRLYYNTVQVDGEPEPAFR